ncbi:MAG: hypothetical protein M5U09_22075 [Gammaproteobacteria bacterium]|nr:hypothetical protein [Gammaproteobacteria bacterium]
MDHWYGHENTVGALRYAKMYPDAVNPLGWRTRVSIRSGPLGDDILSAAREMGIGASIGFEPIDGGRPTPDEERVHGRGGRRVAWVHREWEWMELSLTFMPANVACRGGVVSESDEMDAWRPNSTGWCAGRDPAGVGPPVRPAGDSGDSAARESVPPEAARGGSESGGLTRRGPIGTVVRPDCPAPFA